MRNVSEEQASTMQPVSYHFPRAAASAVWFHRVLALARAILSNGRYLAHYTPYRNAQAENYDFPYRFLSPLKVPLHKLNHAHPQRNM